jgi:hypothetical protein
VERIEDIIPALRRPRAQVSQMTPSIAGIT